MTGWERLLAMLLLAASKSAVMVLRTLDPNNPLVGAWHHLFGAAVWSSNWPDGLWAGNWHATTWTVLA